jgi:tetratricopeptide (TPR) repeat protein
MQLQTAISLSLDALQSAVVAGDHGPSEFVFQLLDLGSDIRLSLIGWRRLEDNNLTAAGDALEQSIALNADEPVAHYRFGRVLAARKDDAAALAQFELAIKHGRACPAPILAATHLEAARLYERGGRRHEALTAYRTAATLFGGAEETRNAASRALARLAK